MYFRNSHGNNRFVLGTKYRKCDEDGFDYLETELYKRRRDGAIVCKACLDPDEKYDRVRISPKGGGY